jgi:membrane fusion protein, copper/silver efflux system
MSFNTMNKKTLLTLAGTGAVMLLVGLIAGRFLLSSSAEHNHSAAMTGEATDISTTWTCSMHPQIRQPGPGNCPICGMALIPVEPGGNEGPRTLTMSESSRALADIQTTLVTRQYPEAIIRLVGKLDYDETRVKSLTARFPARIDELYVNFTGIEVGVGEHLARVYSPELLSAQRELLTAYASNPQSSITKAATEKLRLWDLLPDQVDEILKSGEARDSFELRAPVGGVVAAKNVKEGDYLKTGDPLFKIVDLSQLWLNFDAYESDLLWLRYAQEVSFTVEAFPGETFHGKIAFIDPEVNRETRTVSVRVNVSNTGKRLKPGMFARGEIKARMADGGKVFAPELAGKWICPMHPEIIKDEKGQCDVCGMNLVSAEELGYVEPIEDLAPIVIPTSSVLRTGKRAVVYIEKPDAERPTYEGREIVLGPRAGDYFTVSTGIEEGERIVTQGAFKIDSSLQILAKPSMMSMETGQGTSGEGQGAAAVETVHLEPALAEKLIPNYLELQKALARDELETAKTSLMAMMEITGHQGPVATVLHAMLDAKDLDSLRRPNFEILSNALIQAVKEKPDAFKTPLYQVNCFMAYPNRGADWLQTTEVLENPYFGTSMQSCGTIKATFNGAKDGGQGSKGGDK